jgi:signal transduction histidine kinase
MIEALAPACAAVRETGAPQIAELVIPAGDQMVTFEARVAPVEGLSQVMVVINDITGRKRDEEALEAANQRLQELDYLKDEFMASVSHELRTPITALKIYHRLLGQRPDNWESYLQTASHETQRLEAIIESILSVTQIMKQLQKATVAPVDLTQLVRQTVADWRPRAEEHGLDLSYQPGAEMPPIMGDPALLERVLTIFLDNALKYTPSGGEIRFDTRLDGEAGQSWAILRIANTGPAIPPDEVSQMFNRFFRGKAALESGVSGAGMGLFMASQIVEQHGGSVTLDDGQVADNTGVAFAIRLPANGQRGGTRVQAR